MKSYKWISPQGEIVKATTRQFAEMSGMSVNSAKTLACGRRKRLRGWCSGHPRAKRHRERFLTGLINMETGEKAILGASLKGFARAHGLCFNEVWKLVAGHKIHYRNWVLEKTLTLVDHPLAATQF